MIAILSTVALASVLGSVHCLAMCGPLISLAGGARTVRIALVHALGRLATYVTLGAAAGLVGRAVDLAGRLGSVQRAATLAAGAGIIVWGVYALAAARGLVVPGDGTRFRAGLVRIRSRDARVRALLLGALTGLLPCGWLWAFVVTAAGQADPWAGAAVMFAFWLGTVPAMVGVLGLAGPWLVRLRARLPVVSALVLISLGTATLAVRWRDAGAGQVEHPHCHDMGAMP